MPFMNTKSFEDKLKEVQLVADFVEKVIESNGDFFPRNHCVLSSVLIHHFLSRLGYRVGYWTGVVNAFTEKCAEITFEELRALRNEMNDDKAFVAAGYSAVTIGDIAGKEHEGIGGHVAAKVKLDGDWFLLDTTIGQLRRDDVRVPPRFFTWLPEDEGMNLRKHDREEKILMEYYTQPLPRFEKLLADFAAGKKSGIESAANPKRVPELYAHLEEELMKLAR